MQKYTAIILTSREIGEFDRLYTMYTLEQGLLKVAAKGVRKPAAKLAGHLEPATLSEVYVARSRGRGQITGAIAAMNFKKIKSSLEKLQAFIGASRFFSRFFSEGEADKKIFDLLLNFLKTLDCNAGRGKKGRDELAILAFWWKLFDQMGQKPEVAKCVVCKKKPKSGQNFFSLEKGGIACSVCGPKEKNIFPISDNQIKLLRLFLSNSLENAVKIKIPKEELERLMVLTKVFRKFYFA
ncbi:MAG: DNA repair protein RecO [Parcubacteria group bacterium]|jgi:DNA repair protein RecO (recombination protein O)